MAQHASRTCAEPAEIYLRGWRASVIRASPAAAGAHRIKVTLTIMITSSSPRACLVKWPRKPANEDSRLSRTKRFARRVSSSLQVCVINHQTPHGFQLTPSPLPGQARGPRATMIRKFAEMGMFFVDNLVRIVGPVRNWNGLTPCRVRLSAPKPGTLPPALIGRLPRTHPCPCQRPRKLCSAVCVLLFCRTASRSCLLTLNPVHFAPRRGTPAVRLRSLGPGFRHRMGMVHGAAAVPAPKRASLHRSALGGGTLAPAKHYVQLL